MFLLPLYKKALIQSPQKFAYRVGCCTEKEWKNSVLIAESRTFHCYSLDANISFLRTLLLLKFGVFCWFCFLIVLYSAKSFKSYSLTCSCLPGKGYPIQDYVKVLPSFIAPVISLQVILSNASVQWQ